MFSEQITYYLSEAFPLGPELFDHGDTYTQAIVY